ncbi:MAG: PfkB family carbohydrate kinase [Candidatus Eremiobacterota bacterium]
MKIMNKKIDVTGIGCAAWDLIGTVKNYPMPGDKSPMKNFEEHPGGQVATAITAVSRLGGHAAIIEICGDDYYGDMIRKNLSHEGIDINYLIKDPGKTSLLSFCACIEDTGERSIFFTGGTKRSLEPEDIPSDLIMSSKAILMDNYHGSASVYAASLAVKSAIPVVTDIERNKPCNDELFRKGTHHIVPAQYLLEYTGEKDVESALKAMWNMYHSELIVATMGDRGSIAWDGSDFVCQNAYTIENVADTTGAGDVFHGTFAFGLTLGYDVPANLKFASLVAGLKCRNYGGQKGIPYAGELKNLWKF